jgi:hypothetical protein
MQRLGVAEQPDILFLEEVETVEVKGTPGKRGGRSLITLALLLFSKTSKLKFEFPRRPLLGSS